MLKHVFHILGSNEWVIDGYDVDHGVVLCSTHDKTRQEIRFVRNETRAVKSRKKNLPTNAAKSVDANVDRLQRLGASLAVHDVSEFRLE